MAAPTHDNQREPHPEKLARMFLDHGDGPSALEVCALWRRREPTDPRINELEAEARSTGHNPTGRPALSEDLAERYISYGYFDEALLIFQRIAFRPSAFPDDFQSRLDLLCAVLSYELPEDAPALQVSAEEQLAERHVSVALAMYHELCKASPELTGAADRRDSLRALVGDLPMTALLDKEQLEETVVEDQDTPASQDIPLLTPQQPQRRIPVRTETDFSIPSAVLRQAELEEAEAEGDPQEDSRDSRGGFIDPLDDTQQMDREEYGLAATIALSREQMALARTQTCPSPMVTPQDKDGRSVVELPREVTTAFERARGRPEVQAAAEHAAPFGVIVRPVVILTG